ncbi:MAG: DUF3995 domain-containing protein [Alphaproteobacteria bacterium]|nr:DUF3995 domain-containing protein [Alphaproteobacteria bacterium]
MSAVIAIALFATLAAIALAHAWWAAGGIWPAADAAALAHGVIGDGRRRMPPAWMSGAVAAVLAVVAVWPLLLAGLLAPTVPQAAVVGVGAVFAAVFVVRGIAGYMPAWRRHFAAEPFATRDRRYFSPLCLVLAAGFAALLVEGVAS